MLMLLGIVCRLWFTETFCRPLRSLGTVTWHSRCWVYIRCRCYQSNETVQQRAIGW